MRVGGRPPAGHDHERNAEMRITVDYDLCEANGLCEAMAPDVFALDDDDLLQLKTDETTPDNAASVERAVASCPRAAISWQE
jgi:ferredoxin